MKKRIFILLTMVGGVSAVIFFLNNAPFGEFPKSAVYATESQLASLPAIVKSPYLYIFKVDGTLHEAGKESDSSSPYWWLNSGGMFYLNGGIGKTVHGELPTLNKWRLAYALSNPVDTDNGYHPQNIFRMLTRSQWQSFQEEAYFTISKINLSKSLERNAWSGVLLFNRYQDSNNLYYAGIRVDGNAIIKKKIGGKYYTLAQKTFYSNGKPYDRDTNPNIIPINTWIGLRSEITNEPSGAVRIKVFLDTGKTGNWVLGVEAVDNGAIFGQTISNTGFGGIRTDFMDVQVDDFKITNI